MKSFPPTKTSNAERRTPNAQPGRRGLLLLLLLSLASPLHAQVGNNNPTGVSGIFNGQINTGCSYDPWTGNATRSITDIAVAGAVGEYPLALVRTANSRTPSATEVFGWAGGWNHNYNWILEDSASSTTQNFPPSSYTVDFPDGRVETFKSVTWDTNYRVRAGNGNNASTSAGVRERLAPITPPGNMDAYLILPDGGKVKFHATQHSFNGQYYYKYKVTAIIDPYGLRTTIDSEVTPNGARRRITRVTEPAGRYLQFSYATANGPRISQVSASDGRSVNYYYSYTMLDHVVYYNNANWTARYKYCNANVGDPDAPPLLWTADDPMYPGPMKRIAYEYKPATPNNPDGTTAVYGQILKERYWDGVSGDEGSGAVVSTLTVGAANPINHNVRTETRADGQTRTFTYTAQGYLTWISDFMGHAAHQSYDSYKWINSVTNFNQVTTDYTCDPITGNVTQIKYPLTLGDTPGQGNTRPTVNYTYTDTYYLHTITDEGNNPTAITRDGNNRVTRIDYADGGYETFSYDAAHFYRVSSHRMTTGGTETFTYDTRGLRQTYRNPSNASGNPTARYQYDTLDRVTDITDVLGSAVGDGNHSTSFTYNNRGQVLVTTLPRDPNDNVRHTVTNVYNPDGTLQSKTDQLSHVTNYTYDDYRRVKSVTPPVRGFGDNSPHAASLFYDANGTGNDYRYTDSSVTYVTFPSGKRIKGTYDDNRRKISVIVGYGTTDQATTSYGYDNVGNLTSVTNPLNYSNVTTDYDERNRPSSMSVGSQTTDFTYDTAGRRKTITRPNGQVITYETFDAMNRVTQQTATQSPDPSATTKYAYTPAGLLYTMQDPRLVATNSTEKYTYTYDNMGRKTQVQFPLDSYNVRRTEQWSYDTVGRLYQFTNRNSKIQTFTYDPLNRMTGFSWNDGGTTPSVSFGYDVASRLTSINNAKANITRAYFNDNLLRSETESITGASSKTVTYSYDADGNRASTQYPDNYTFNYTYTGRNQLKSVTNYATYDYNARGNLTTRTLLPNQIESSYLYDNLDRVTSIQHLLNGTTRTLNYGYYPNSNNRKWTKHEDGYGDVFGYDLADQVTAVLLDVQNPDTTSVGDQSIFYDGSGNRTVFRPYESQDAYTVNDLNQYTGRTASDNPLRPTPTPRPPPTPPPHPSPTATPTPPGQQTAAYDYAGNMTTGFDGSIYIYDAQNRLVNVTKGGVTMTFAYDALNRQVTRTVNPVGQSPDWGTTFSVWDGWDLIEEYQSGNNVTAAYLYGPDGVVKNLTANQFYYHDGSGSTSHLADSAARLLEWYRYDLQGTPVFYDANNNQLSASAYGVRHLFTGQQWYSDIGLYDLRNRFYSPDLGRFLQPDPIGFWGDRTNLYRYARNNPVTWSDPSGCEICCNPAEQGDNTPTVERVTVEGAEPPTFGGGGGGPSGGGGGGGDGPGGRVKISGITFAAPLPPRNNNSNTQQQPPPQNPPLPFNLFAFSMSPVLQAVVVTLPSGEQYIPMTTIKNLAQARVLGRFVGSPVPIFVPPGQNPQATINYWGSPTFPGYPTFINDFMPTGTNDFKLPSKSGPNAAIYDAYGNFLYGASGTAAGLPASLLQAMGHVFHGGQNNPINVYDIQLGIDAVDQGGTVSVVTIGFNF